MRGILAFDPGAVTGTALVAPGAGREKPRLLWAGVVAGDPWDRWIAEAGAALGAALLAAQAAKLTVLVAVEEPPPVSRGGSLEGDRHGQRSWLGIGRRQGALLTLASIQALPCRRVEQGNWTAAMRVPTGKQGDGAHRLQEAYLHLEGARDVLGHLPEKGRIDAAEAALLGCALARGLL